jgi:hypothetical protein
MIEDKPLAYGMNVGTMSTIGVGVAAAGVAAHAARRIVFDKYAEDRKRKQEE